MKSKYKILVFFLFVIQLSSFAQFLKFTGFATHENEPLEGASVLVLENDKIIAQTLTNEKGFFLLKLTFNHNYSIKFEKQGFCTMYALVNGSVPDDKQDYNIKFEIRVPFFDFEQKELNLKVFEKPITKVYFDGNSRFIDDPMYITNFYKELNNEIPPQQSEKKPKVEPATSVNKEQPKVSEKQYQLVGKVLHAEEGHLPFSGVKVSIYDSLQHEVYSTITNKLGVFCFPSVNIKNAAKINVDSNSESTNKVVLTNYEKEKVADETKVNNQKVEFSSTPKNKMFDKLVRDNYTTFLAGKIGVEENGENKLLANKFIYLMTEDHEVIEKVRTNQFGEFLFTKLPLDKNYIIAVDENDTELGINNKLKLYTVKDVLVNAKDSLIKGKFQYKFLVNDSKSFYEMIVDDTKLRMDLNGKIAGDKTTNAIENLKLYLLNKDKNIIDSTLSGKDGEFKFKYIPYSDQFYFKIKDTSIVNSYKSIIIYDKNGNIVKYVSVKNKEIFEYKLLQNDLTMLQEIYLHDPWMNLSYQVSKNNPTAPVTIMESIYFESGKADIMQASKQTLDKIAFTLKNNPKIKIEIGAHSDSKGSDELNLKLSEKRAQSALNYFVSKGIEANRITAIGYGEKKLLNKCVNGVICSEEEHAKNRRLEFKVIMQ